MVRIENLSFSYSRKGAKVYDGLDLSFAEGKIYGLLGRNGVGKSTLLYLMAGALTPSGGKVLVNGVDSRLRLPKTFSDIFIVPEEFTMPSIPFADYVKAHSGFYPKFSHEDFIRHLLSFELQPDVNLGSLSMGQKKKAFMCFAMACNTSLLLMDEPTNGLDIPGKSNFRRLISTNMTDERTIIISTHQVRDVETLLDHVTILGEDGLIFNRSLHSVASRLRFFTTDNKALASEALFSRASLGGAEIIIPGSAGQETAVNMETLFEFALSEPELLNNQFIETEDGNEE